MPVVEARSQLALAKLLLQHTHNAAEARSHLERAVHFLYLKTQPDSVMLLAKDEMVP